MSWLRNDVRTGSRPESGSSKSTISGSSTRARARPARLRMPPEISPGQLVLGAEQADQVHLLHDDVADLRLGLPGVLAQREGDVVVEVHRAEHRAVLEQHAEQLADLVELALGAGGDVDALDDDRAPVGLEQADQRLEQDGLARAGRAEHHADLTGGDRQGDVAPDELLAEGLGQSLDLDLHAHGASVSLRIDVPGRGRSASRSPLPERSTAPAARRLRVGHLELRSQALDRVREPPYEPPAPAGRPRSRPAASTT